MELLSMIGQVKTRSGEAGGNIGWDRQATAGVPHDMRDRWQNVPASPCTYFAVHPYNSVLMSHHQTAP